MNKELAGQWMGEVKGVHFGGLILNIDQNKSDEISIMFDDQSPDGVPLVVRSFIIRYPNTFKYRGNLGNFKYFDRNSRNQIQVQANFSSAGEIFFEKFDDILVGNFKTNNQTEGTFTVERQGLKEASPIKEVISWDEFKRRVSKYFGSRGEYYFRGHETSEYSLRNLLNRMNAWNLDRYFGNIVNLFEGLGKLNQDRYRLHDGDDFGAGLLLAQHHGYPTPLMDWTTSPFIASYFAFRPFKRKKHDCNTVRVFCFHQRRWMSDNLAIANSGLVSPWIVIRPLNLPLGNNSRAISQDAVSLFSNVENIEPILLGQGNYLEYYDIDFQEQNVALAELQAMGIHEERLFPDLETVCKVHKKHYFGTE